MKLGTKYNHGFTMKQYPLQYDGILHSLTIRTYSIAFTEELE